MGRPSAPLAPRLVLSREDRGGLEVWALEIDQIDPGRLGQVSLAPEEHRRADMQGDPGGRIRYAAAHGLLRQVLGGRLGVRPETIVLTRQPCPACGGPHGRPALAEPGADLHFSLSYRAELAVVALAEAPVGVDIELVPEAEVADEVKTLLHPRERQELAALAGGARSEVFAELWTRKEAYLKGYGTGIAGCGLSATYLGGAGTEPWPAGWWITNVPVPEGYRGAVAVQLGA